MKTTLAIAVIVSFRQKRIPFQSISLLVIAVLFMASGIFQYANDNFIRPLPVLQQIEFSKSLRPIQVSGGFASTGFGMAWLFLSGITFTKLEPPVDETRKKLRFMFMIGVGILWLILGISSIFNGPRHL